MKTDHKTGYLVWGAGEMRHYESKNAAFRKFAQFRLRGYYTAVDKVVRGEAKMIASYPL